VTPVFPFPNSSRGPSPLVARVRATGTRSARFPLPGALALSCLALAGAARADGAEGLVTDRPDFVESSDVVGRGRFQLETGLASTREEAGQRELATPTLFRLGVSDTLELRLETDGWSRRTGDGATTSGMNDTTWGFKWRQQAGDEPSDRPGVAWLFDVAFPTGSTAFRGDGARPQLRAVAEWDLPHDFSVGVMPGLTLDRRDDGHRFLSGLLAVTVGHDLGQGWHAFGEVAARRIASSPNGGSQVTLDTGLAWAVSPDVQFDVAFAHGLVDASPRLEADAGVSIRF
jgi:hypothetical protein